MAWAHHEKPHKKVDSTDYASWKSPVVRSLTGAAGMPLVGSARDAAVFSGQSTPGTVNHKANFAKLAGTEWGPVTKKKARPALLLAPPGVRKCQSHADVPYIRRFGISPRAPVDFGLPHCRSSQVAA